MNRTHDKPRVNWQTDKLFTSELPGHLASTANEKPLRLAVQVSKLPLPRPQFTVEVGCLRWVDDRDKPGTQKEVFARHFRFFYATTHNVVHDVADNVIDTVERLLKTAREYIKEQLQEATDAFQEQREQKELAFANRGKQATNVTGKTARKKGRGGPDANATAIAAGDHEFINRK